MARNGTPLYRRIADDLIHKIESGGMKPHDPFPTQLELARMYNTSEITSKRAYMELAKAGYVYRIKRKGTFVEDRSGAPRTEGGTEGASARAGHAKPAPTTLQEVRFVYSTIRADRFNHRFFADLLEGMSQACEERGIPFATHEFRAGDEPPDSDRIGVIAVNLELEELKRWKAAGSRMATVHGFVPGSGIPYAIGDNLTGGFIATEHLLSLGHRRIGILLTGPSPLLLNQEFNLRLQGYRLALSQYGLETDQELIFTVDAAEDREELGEAGFAHFRSLANPPTAVFCASDYQAIGFMRAARVAGVRVPEDVSVVGYDDVAFGRWTSPALTTVDQNTFEIGRKAVLLLAEEADRPLGDGRVRDEIVVPALVVRGSTAPCGQADN